MSEQTSGQVIKDSEGRVVGITHIEKPFPVQEEIEAAAAVEIPLDPQQTAEFYVQQVAALYQIPDSAVAALSESATDTYIEGEDSTLRLAEEKTSIDAHIVSYAQTYRGLTVHRAGLVVRMAGPDNLVLGSGHSFHADIDMTDQYWSDFETATYRAGEAAVETRLKGLLDQAGLAFEQINSQRNLVYRYVEQDRKYEPDEGGFESISLPDLASEPLPPEIEDGKHYVVTECFFTSLDSDGFPLNWVIFFEALTGAVLYVRPLIAGVEGLVFPNDPVSMSGDAAISPLTPANQLDAYRRSKSLERLALPAPPADVELIGRFVELVEWLPIVAAPPTEPNGTAAVFNYGCATTDFAAVNAYYHMDQLYKFVESLGFDLATYFDGASFPVPVDHRGENGDVNAHAHANVGGNGIGRYRFGLTDAASAVGIAADARVVCHEFGHGVLYDHLNSGTLGFAHGIGDSLAAVLYDPESHAPDRFSTFPFNNLITRRHDRTSASWQFGGANDNGGYQSTEILATVMFRAYRAIGGDDRALSERQYASRYIAYLLLQAPTLLGILIPDTADGFATALQEADVGTRFFDGYSGAAVHKVVRWAFEQQSLFGGDPPPVDVYLDDGRGGEYGYPAEELKSGDIWNRHSADGGLINQRPEAGETNYLYVRVRNRGTMAADDVAVQAFQPSGNDGLLWPDDWEPLDTPLLNLGAPIPAGGDAVVGPFEWIPAKECGNQVLVSCSADGDDSNISRLSGEILTRRLATFDNNIALGDIENSCSCACLKAPTVDAVVSPTTDTSVTLTGGKESGTAIQIRGVEVVAADNSETWSADANLALGGNLIPIVAVRANGETSDPAYAYVDRQMYVQLSGDTMTGALQLDNADAAGGLRMRSDDVGVVEWNIKADDEDVRIEHNPTASTLTIGKA